MKYLAYLGSGGLTHMLSGIGYCAEKSIELNRILILKTENHTAFSRKFSKYFYLDLSLNFIEDNNQVENLTEEENILLNLQPQWCSVGKYKINDTFIHEINNNSEDKIIFFHKACEIKYLKHIKCHKNIINQIPKLDSYQKTLGVHFRNTDIKSDYKTFLKVIKEKIKTNKINLIYLATDDYQIINQINKDISIKIINFTNPPINKGNGGIHHISTFDKDTLIMNTLIDIYNLINCEYFIPTITSSLSRWILELRKSNTLFSN